MERKNSMRIMKKVMSKKRRKIISENTGVTNEAFESDLPHDNPTSPIPGPPAIPPRILEENTTTDETDRKRKRNIWKNLVMLSLGFFFLFLSFNALSNIQSSLNPDEGLGTVSLSVIYASMIVSSMFLPSILGDKIGYKWTLVTSSVLFLPFVAANIFPTWYSLIPTSCLLGFASGPLWSAQGTYLTQIGREYSNLVKEAADVITVRFFGIFFMVLECGEIVGNLISSLVLQNAEHIKETSNQEKICGAAFCARRSVFESIEFNSSSISISNSTLSNEITDVDKDNVYILCGTYLICSLAASLLMAALLDPLGNSENDETNGSSNVALLLATLRQMKLPHQLLLIPLTIFSGLEQGFMTVDFTDAMVTCSLGISYVGYVMVCHYVMVSLGSVAFERLIQLLGRVTIFTAGFVANVVVAVVVLCWTPDPHQISVFFVLAGLWGLGDSIWLTQILGLYSALFETDPDAVFANHNLWECIGFIFYFAIAEYLCLNVKVYFLMTNLVIGMICYYLIEINLWRKKTANYSLKSEEVKQKFKI